MPLRHIPHILLIVACVLSGCSKQDKLKGYLKSAQAYLENHQLDRAEIEFKNAAKVDDMNPAAYAGIGDVYFKRGLPKQAYPYLDRATRLDPGLPKPKSQLGYLYLAFGDRSRAFATAQEVLEAHPDFPEAIILLADAASNAEEVAAAIALLESSANPAAHDEFALGMLAAKSGDADTALSRFDAAIATDSDFLPPRVAKATLLLRQGQQEEAEELLRAVSDSAEPYSNYTIFYPQYLLGTGAIDPALARLDAIIEATPDFFPARVLKMKALQATGKLEECRKVVEHVLSNDPTHLDALTLRTEIALSEQDFEKAKESAEQTLQSFPQNPLAFYHLARAQLGLQELGQAASTLRQAIGVAPNSYEARSLLARLTLNRGDFSNATIQLKKLVSLFPDNLEAKALLAESYRRQSNFDDAVAMLEQVAAKTGDQPGPFFSIGQIHLQNQDNASARRSFQTALERSPQYLPAVEQLTLLDVKEGQIEQARSRLDQLRGTYGDSGNLRLLAGRIDLAEKDTKAAEEDFLKGLELDPENLPILADLSRLYFQTGQQDLALNKLEQVLAKNPADSGSRLLAALIHEQLGDFDQARQQYEQLLERDSMAVAALNNLAYLYAEHFDNLERASELAGRAREMHPNNPAIADTFAWIRLKQGETEWALSVLEDTAAKLPGSAEASYHLGTARYLSGLEESAKVALEQSLGQESDFRGSEEVKAMLEVLALGPDTPAAEAKAALEKRLEAAPMDPIAWRKLGSIDLSAGKHDQAEDDFREALKSNGKYAQALLGLAQTLEKKGTESDRSQALEYAKAAYGEAPANAEIALTFGRLLQETGQWRWSQSALTEATQAHPENALLRFNLGVAQLSVGDMDASERSFRGAIELSSSETLAASAKAYLAFLPLSLDPAETATDFSGPLPPMLDRDRFLPLAWEEAQNFRRNDKLAEAAQTYRDIIKRYPEFPPAKRSLTIVLSQQAGNIPGDALLIAQEARKAFTSDRALQRASGVLEYRSGEPAKALTLLPTGDEDAISQLYRGASLIALERTDDGKTLVEAAARKDLPGRERALAEGLLSQSP